MSQTKAQALKRQARSLLHEARSMELRQQRCRHCGDPLEFVTSRNYPEDIFAEAAYVTVRAGYGSLHDGRRDLDGYVCDDCLELLDRWLSGLIKGSGKSSGRAQSGHDRGVGSVRPTPQDRSRGER